MGTLEAFENVKAQIGPCGIWCGSCVVGNGALRELTRRYEELTVAYGLAEWAPRDFSYEEFSKGLASLRDMDPCPGCVRGGGREGCEIRACASNHGNRVIGTEVMHQGQFDIAGQGPAITLGQHGGTGWVQRRGVADGHHHGIHQLQTIPLQGIKAQCPADRLQEAHTREHRQLQALGRCQVSNDL